MSLLQRYILVELLKVFFFLLSALTVLLVFVGVFREIQDSGLGPFQVLQILPFIIPSLLPFTIPATLLLTVSIVYGRIAGDNEVIAAKAAGISVLSLLWPSFVVGAILSICSLILSDQVIPWAVRHIQHTVTMAMEDIFLDVLRSNHQFTDRGRGISITVKGVEDKTLIRPTFQFNPHNRQPMTMQAETATLEFDLEKQEVILHLVKGEIDIPGERRVSFDKESKPFPLPNEIKKTKARHLSILDIRQDLDGITKQLDEKRQRRDIEAALAMALGDFDRLGRMDMGNYTQELELKRIDLAKLRTEVHSRFALSSSCLFFTLIGGPFAILQGRRQFLTSFIMCFLPILIIYYPIVLLMMNLSKTAHVNPAWSMWVANAILLVAGCFVLRRTLKH